MVGAESKDNANGANGSKAKSSLPNVALPMALFGLFAFILMSTGTQGDAVLAGSEGDELLYNVREGLKLAGFLLCGIFIWRRPHAFSGKASRICLVLLAALYVCCAFVMQVASLGALLVGAVMTMALLSGLAGGLVYEKVALLVSCRLAARSAATDAKDRRPLRDGATRMLGVVVGFGGAAAVIVQYLLQLELTLGVWFIVLLAACFCLLMYLIDMAAQECGRSERPPASARGKAAGHKQRALLKQVLFLVAIVACLYALLPFYEVVIRNAFSWAVFYQWHRLFVAVGYLVIGAAAFFGGRPVASLVVAVAFLFAAFLMAQSALPQMDNFTQALFYALLGAVIAYSGIAFMSLAPQTACPALVASAGRMIDGTLTIAGSAIPLIGVWPVSGVLLVALVLIALIIALMVRGGFFAPAASADAQGEGGQAEEEPQANTEEPSMDASQVAAIAEHYGLTRRETEVLGLVLRGLTVQQMADTLVVTKSTVKFHVTNILKKTGAESRQQMLEKISHEEE